MNTRRSPLPEYLIEAFGLGVILFSASLTGTALGYAGSPVGQVVSDPIARRAVAGAVLGLSVLLLILSPWGQRSGAHFNPAFSLTFWRLHRMKARDAAFYAAFQTVGGLIGVLSAHALLGSGFALPPVSFLVTVPGGSGVWVAFTAEATMSFALMAMVLWTGRAPSLARMTGPLAALFLAVFVLAETPLSGTSLNPARSLASALPAGVWTAFWVYMIAPPLGMIAAAEVFVRTRGLAPVGCARLSRHHRRIPCILCGHVSQPMPSPQNPGGIS